MKKLRAPSLVAALIVAAGSLAVPTSAQVDPDIQLGSKIPVRPAKPDPVLDGLIRDQYVRCAYGPNKDILDALLRGSDPVTADLEAAGIEPGKFFRQHTLRQCFEAEGQVVQASIQFSPTAFRYLMLEAAYRSAVRELPAELEGHLASPRAYVSAEDQLPLARSLGAFSDCIAAHDAPAADRLLRTNAGSEGEKEAAMALVPALSACIVAGQQLKLTPANIRAFAADGMWQRFVAPSEASQ